MAINRYVCPTFEEELEPKQLIDRILESRHSKGYERKYFEGLLEIINRTPFNIALIDGVIKGSPIDPSPDNPVSKKLIWVAFHPKWGKEWDVLKHNGYMLLPYKTQLETITPLLSVEFHTRKYIGSNSDGIKYGEVQITNRIRYDQGRTQPIMLLYNPQGAEQRKKERMRNGSFNPNDRLREILDNFEVDQLNAPELGPAPTSPSGISSALTKDVRYKIWEFITLKGNQFPQNWSDADFYELSCSFLAKTAGLPQTDKDDLNMMEGFYSKNKIEFVDITKLK